MNNHSRFIFVVLSLLGATALPAQRPEDKPLPPPPPVHAEFFFNFTPGMPDPKYTPVQPDKAYSSEKGHGFDYGTKPVGESPYFFSVKVPEGNYRITATFGDRQSATDTTVRTESGHIMATNITLAANSFTTREFIANVRRPQISPPAPRNAPGEPAVHMFLAGEAEARCWDEKLTIEFNGSRPRIAWMSIVKDDQVPTIFMAGDSTVGDPRRGPGGNWPTQLCQFLKPEVAVCNSAEGGETSKSFITGQRLDKVRPGSERPLDGHGTEELSHLEIVGTLARMHLQPMKAFREAAEVDPLVAIAGGGGVCLFNSMGNPWTADYLKITGELDVDLRSNIAAEARAKIVYERLINFCDDVGTRDALQFLMTREITHMKAFAAALESMQKPAFSIGQIPPTPGLVDQFFNDSTGKGDDGEVDARGPGTKAATGNISRPRPCKTAKTGTVPPTGDRKPKMRRFPPQKC